MKDYSVIEKEAERLNKTFFASSGDALKAVEDLGAKAPEFFSVIDLNIEEVYSDVNEEVKYIPRFDFRKMDRKITLRKDPKLFGDVFPPVQESDTSVLRLYSIGMPNKYVQKDITKSFRTHEEFLCALYDECRTNQSKSSNEFLNDTARQYFKDLDVERREELYRKYLEIDEFRKATYFEEAQREFDESLDMLRNAARGDGIEWLLDTMLNAMDAEDWKKPAILDLVQAARNYDIDEFSSLSEKEQINVLIDNCMDMTEVHQHVYDSLVEYIDEKYFVVLFYVENDNLIGTWIKWDLWDPDFDEFQHIPSWQSILVTNKELFAKRYFGIWGWDNIYTDETMEFIEKTIEYYRDFLNGYCYEACVYRNGILEYNDNFYGTSRKVLNQLREDLDISGEFRDFFDKNIFRDENGEIELI